MQHLVTVLFMMCCFAATSTLKHEWLRYKSPSIRDEPHDDSLQCLPEGSDGREYRGTVSVTSRGNKCLRWTRLKHLVEISASKGLGAHKYCRNPNNSLMPWCGVKRGDRIVREFCDIPKCEAKPQPETPVQDTETTCGERPLNKLSKIVGGYRSSIESQPWTASIFKRKGFFICGGTLIAPCWVLTAAHCFSSGQGSGIEHYSVHLGKDSTDNYDPNKEQEFKVAELVIHEDYSFIEENYNNDIALIRIEDSKGQCAQRTRTVRTVCLPPAQRMMPSGAFCHVAGYGSEKSSQILYSRYLKEALVKLISPTVCKKDEYYGKSEIPLTENMFCAASPSWADDACQGDSGGPLVCEAGGRMFLFGIISWGEECAAKFKPGVYTKVTNYNKWIAKKTGLRSFTTGIMYPQKD